MEYIKLFKNEDAFLETQPKKEFTYGINGTPATFYPANEMVADQYGRLTDENQTVSVVYNGNNYSADTYSDSVGRIFYLVSSDDIYGESGSNAYEVLSGNSLDDLWYWDSAFKFTEDYMGYSNAFYPYPTNGYFFSSRNGQDSEVYEVFKAGYQNITFSGWDGQLYIVTTVVFTSKNDPNFVCYGSPEGYYEDKGEHFSVYSGNTSQPFSYDYNYAGTVNEIKTEILDEFVRVPKPGVVCILDKDKVLYNDRKKKLYKITITYEVSSTTEPTFIVGNMACITEKAVLDGETVLWDDSPIYERRCDEGCSDYVIYGMPNEYTFETTGRHTIEFYVNEPRTCTSGFWFGNSYDSQIVEVVLGEGITTIDDCTFSYLTNITAVTFPSTLTRSEYGWCHQYSQCNFQKVNFTGTIDQWCRIEWGDGAYGWPLNCGNGLFYLNDVLCTDVVISSAVKNVNDCAFRGCTSITSLTVSEGVESLGQAFVRTSLTRVSLPSTLSYFSFAYCTGLTSVTLANGMVSLTSGSSGSWGGIAGAFVGCTSLSSITLPNSLEAVGSYAFSGCTSLKELHFGPNMHYFGNYIIDGSTGLTSLTFDQNMQVVDVCSGAFTSHLSLLSSENGIYYLNDHVAYRRMNSNVSSTTFTLKSTTKSIARDCFYQCSSATTIQIPNGTVFLGALAFQNCKIANLVIPDSVKTISSGCFAYCPITSVTIGSGVEKIDGNIFSYNAKIDATRFTNNSSLDEVSNNYWGALVYDERASNNKLYIKDHVVIYCISNSATTNVVIPNTVTGITDACFSGNSYLTSVTIGSGVEEIGSSAFQGTRKISAITIPNNVQRVGNACFSGATALTSVTIGTGLTELPDYCFAGCSKLSAITIPGNIQTIGRSAFYYCSGLTSLTLNPGLINIRYQAFYMCKLLTGVTLPSTVKSVGEASFSYCYSITSFTLNNGIETVGRGFVDMCSAITSISIPDSVSELPSYVFSSMKNLQSITMGTGITKINDRALYSLQGLTSITINATTPPTLNGVICQGVKENGVLHYPSGCDYSEWLQNEYGYLGYYGWTGQTF